MASDPLLDVAGLGLVKQHRTLLDDVGFALQPGCFYGLLGPNGAGKSSLLRLLYRADRADRGDIRFAGQPIARIGRRAYAARVGALVQEQVSLAGLSLREVIRLGLLPLRLSPAAAAVRIEAALDEIGLGERADDDAARLSGGEQQRLFFGQLLALEPELYLLDEPHNHLDLHFQYRLLDTVRQRGRTVLASFTTSPRRALCDEVLLGSRPPHRQGAPAVLTRERLAGIYRIAAQFSGGQLTVAGAL